MARIMRRLSWAPINFRRWNNVALVLGELKGSLSFNLGTAIRGMKVSWERLGDDIDEFFQPSGPPGTHAAHHYHGPIDPDVREAVLAAIAADYESSLMYLDVALQLSVEALNDVGILNQSNWKKLVRDAESREESFASRAHDIILYLQRTPLYVRNDMIVHPRAMLPVISNDNVGNLSMFRLSRQTPSDYDLHELDTLIHSVKKEIRADAAVGRNIDPKIALNWLGTLSYTVDDWKELNRLRETFGFLLPGAYEIGPKVDAMINLFIEIMPSSELTDVVFALQTKSSHPGMADGEYVAGLSSSSIPREKYEARLDAGIAAEKADNHEEARRIFRECVADNPEDGLAHFLLALALAALDSPTEALEHLYIAQAIGGGDPAVIQRELITSHFNVARSFFNEENYQKAIKHYSRAFGLDPANVEVQRHLMEALAAHDEVDAALWHAGILLRDHGKDPNVQLDVARLFLKTGESQRSLYHAKQALTLRPEWQEASELCTKAHRLND